ncbi:helix-turn-helix domain-containing protein [Mesorhizobium sp. A556]
MAALQDQSLSATQELRLEAGAWLRELRDAAGLSQRVMARMLGLDYYTFISQLENGRGRIPPNRYRDWAHVLGVDDKVFAKTLLQFYEPVIYAMLFEEEAKSRPRISVA